MPVHVGAISHRKPDGTRHHYTRASFDAVAVARTRFTATVTRADGTVETVSAAPSHVEKYVELLEKEGAGSAVARARVQWSLPEQTPTSLNNILEIIRDDVSGGDPDRGRAWATMARTMATAMRVPEQQLDDELRRCRESLRDPAAVGPQARHPNVRHVANPMNLDEAREFVRRALLGWLRDKS